MSRPLYQQFFPGLLLFVTGVLCIIIAQTDAPHLAYRPILLANAVPLAIAGAVWLLTAGFVAAKRKMGSQERE